jgi:hypothetical protein
VGGRLLKADLPVLFKAMLDDGLVHHDFITAAASPDGIAAYLLDYVVQGRHLKVEAQVIAGVEAWTEDVFPTLEPCCRQLGLEYDRYLDTEYSCQATIYTFRKGSRGIVCLTGAPESGICESIVRDALESLNQGRPEEARVILSEALQLAVLPPFEVI